MDYDFHHFIDPETATIIAGAAAGSLIVPMVRKLEGGWKVAAQLFVVGQISAFYATVYIAMLFGVAMAYYGGVAGLVGVVAWFFWGGVIGVFLKFREDPLGTITGWWRLIRGQ